MAKNSYGDLFGKVVDKMNRQVKWEEYVAEVKNVYSEMANNCLYYGVSQEKGVVLNGPPGGGKTFLARTWLSENEDVHDISTSTRSFSGCAPWSQRRRKGVRGVFSAPSGIWFRKTGRSQTSEYRSQGSDV
ncbi:MAG: hypothetical protein LJE94_13105 [Deltaproteobacteria bacterium]|nr:hypothetical protein [Deltaproteobacteria bacterium]